MNVLSKKAKDLTKGLRYPASDFVTSSNVALKMEIGQVTEGKGIYQGIWLPTDSNDRRLGRVFDLYVAPEDIKDGNDDNLVMTFNDTVRHVAGIRDFHGHNGSNFENDNAVMQAVQNNPEQLRNWFIPTKEIWHGENTDGEKVQPNNLFDQRESMPRGSEFITTSSHSIGRNCYWSCTEYRGNESGVYLIDASDGEAIQVSKENFQLSTRLIRAELRF